LPDLAVGQLIQNGKFSRISGSEKPGSTPTNQ